MPRRRSACVTAAWLISPWTDAVATARRISGVMSLPGGSRRVRSAIWRSNACCTCGTSIVWPPTLATQVSVPTSRTTSPTPQMTKATTISRKNARATQVSR